MLYSFGRGGNLSKLKFRIPRNIDDLAQLSSMSLSNKGEFKIILDFLNDFKNSCMNSKKLIYKEIKSGFFSKSKKIPILVMDEMIYPNYYNTYLSIFKTFENYKIFFLLILNSKKFETAQKEINDFNQILNEFEHFNIICERNKNLSFSVFFKSINDLIFSFEKYIKIHSKSQWDFF